METKVCSKCLESFPIEHFWKSKHHTSGRYPWCRACKRQTYKDAGYAAKNAIGWRRRTYGITDEEYQALRESHNYRCAICDISEEEEGKALAIDHCHKTGRIRGLLCNKCNRALGHFKDDPVLVEKAAAYLRQE